MFAALAPIALLALSVFTQAAPIPHGRRASNAPAHWATQYLENYDVYHERYVQIGCNGQHGSKFFDMCCHPMLAGELLSAKPAECIPTAAQKANTDEESCDSEEPAAAASVTVAAAVIAPAPTTSAAPAPAATEAAPAPSSGKEKFGDAHATYFWQNGNPGACGNWNSDDTPLVAIPWKFWGGGAGQKSDACGKYVDITRNSDGRTVKAVVADLCPTCTTANSLDLSWGAFDKIATADEGQVDITWSWSS